MTVQVRMAFGGEEGRKGAFPPEADTARVEQAVVTSLDHSYEG